MLPLNIVVAVLACCLGFGFIFGIVAGGAIERKQKTVGTLIIDQTGVKDLWTIIFDEDLGDVEKEPFVYLKVDRRE